jgi:hypothetical protein
VDRWLEHVDALRSQVLGEGVESGHCDHAIQAQRGASDAGDDG